MAQTQERTLEERLKHPDRQRIPPYQNKSFIGGGLLAMRSSPTADRKFYDAKAANLKEFSFTRSFLGLKNPWIGNQVYDTKNAAVWSRAIMRDADNNVTVRKAEAGASSDATKTVNLGSPVVPVRPFVPAPASQGAVSQITDKIKKNMSIDDIRDLLNKSR